MCYGNVLKFLGRTDQAEAEYQRAGELDPTNPHVWFNLADLAADRGDYAEAIRLWQRVLEMTPHSKLPAKERQLFLETARDSLKALRGYAGPISRHAVPLSTRPALSAAEGTVEGEAMTSSPLHPAQPSQEARPIPRVGRNQPCPCGSGKKYKHCHGRRVK